MSESYIQALFAERIGGARFGQDTVLYKFEKIKRAKREAQDRFPGVPLIDLGVGEPDWMADPRVVRKLAEEAARWENRGYADNGIQTFKDAAAAYMARVYGVRGLNPDTEIIHSIGSKPALAMLAQAFINPGDVLLSTVPGYPVTATMTRWLGGEVYPLPLREADQFLPRLDTIPPAILKRAKLLYLNYPNNPTGAVATPGFFEQVADFARRHHVVVIQDCAYGALTFDGQQPLSYLATPGALETGVEVHSLSKAFNMTGWRLGFVAGNERVVKAFGAVKDNNDSGQFKAIQLAGAHALACPEITEETCAKYSRRHNLLVAVLNRLGFHVAKPRASFYLYAAAPRRVKGGPVFATAEDFSEWLIREKLISTVPWDDAGAYVRFSVTYVARDEDEERRIMDDLATRLVDVELEW